MMSFYLPNTPIIVGADRLKSVTWANSEFKKARLKIPSLYILDDGLQHLKIRPDIRILLLNQNISLKSEKLLPLGILREHPTHLAQRRIDFVINSHQVVFSKENRQKKSEIFENFSCPFFQNQSVLAGPAKLSNFLRHSQQLKSELDTKGSYLLVSAIANPQRLVTSLNKRGFSHLQTIFFPDHHPLPMHKIKLELNDYDALITTAKDYFRHPKLYLDIQKKVYIIDSHCQFSDSFKKQLLEKIL